MRLDLSPFFFLKYLLFFRLKTIDIVIRNTKDAENTLKSYEARLRDVTKVPDEQTDVEDQRSQLKVASPADEPGYLFFLSTLFNLFIYFFFFR